MIHISVLNSLLVVKREFHQGTTPSSPSSSSQGDTASPVQWPSSWASGVSVWWKAGERPQAGTFLPGPQRRDSGVTAALPANLLLARPLVKGKLTGLTPCHQSGASVSRPHGFPASSNTGGWLPGIRCLPWASLCDRLTSSSSQAFDVYASLSPSWSSEVNETEEHT